jgi:Zn-dependent M28 family amino/carboxypeptidase
MTRRGKRLVRGAVIVGVLFVYWQTATWLEQRSIDTQRTATPSGAGPHYVDRDRLMADVTLLASPQMEGRRTGTAGGLKAREWIASQFRAIGLEPAGRTEYLQPFTFTHFSIKGFLLPGRPAETRYDNAANVIGRLAGSRAGTKPIVISAHYDHLGKTGATIYHGADDNASGVAMLLAVARHLRMHPLTRPAIFATFDAEELGLKGSQVFVDARTEANTAAMNVNLDMVSRNDRHEIFAAGIHHYPQFKPMLEDVRSRARVQLLFGHDRPIYRSAGVDDWTWASDHGAFHGAGVPFVYFGVEDHADYHTPTDTADKIDRQFFGDVADMIVDAVLTFDARLP